MITAQQQESIIEKGKQKGLCPVALYTAQLDLVTIAFIMPFVTSSPDVVFWGARCFALSPGALAIPRYIEAFGASAVDQCTVDLNGNVLPPPPPIQTDAPVIG